MTRPERSSYDVLIVGSGGAGLRAAIAAAEAGAQVAVVTKGSLLYSGATASANFSYCAQLGYFGAEDTAACYANDLVASGRGLSDPSLAETFALGAGDEAVALERYGLAWRRDPNGRYSVATFAGHRFPRAIHVGLRTGKAIMVVLGQTVVRSRVDIWEYAFALRVLRDEQGVTGLAMLDLVTGGTRALAAPAVILATGGPIAMYDLHTNPDELTGDGFGLAFDAGAELVDVEFIQSYPTVFVSPAAARGLHYPTGRLLGRGAYLVNARGEDFFSRHSDLPVGEATRDEISRVIALEIMNGGGTERGGVFVDARAVPPEVLRDVHFESYFRDIGVDASTDLQEVTAAPHYGLGGIRIDREGRTSVPGLFAAGEVTGGLHGANRLTGTALPEAIVFGSRAGRSAAAYARGRDSNAPPRDLDDGAWLLKPHEAAPDERTDAVLVGQVATTLRRVMQTHAAVVKSRRSLETALEAIDSLKRDMLPRLRVRSASLRFNWEMVQILELRFMLTAARLHCVAALLREESRGAHLRIDFPQQDDRTWTRHIVLFPHGTEIVVGYSERGALA